MRVFLFSTNLNITDLPMHETGLYTKKPDNLISTVLKTSAKKQDTLGIYYKSSMYEHVSNILGSLTSVDRAVIEPKCIMFNSDEELLDMLYAFVKVPRHDVDSSSVNANSSGVAPNSSVGANGITSNDDMSNSGASNGSIVDSQVAETVSGGNVEQSGVERSTLQGTEQPTIQATAQADSQPTEQATAQVGSQPIEQHSEQPFGSVVQTTSTSEPITSNANQTEQGNQSEVVVTEQSVVEVTEQVKVATEQVVSAEKQIEVATEQTNQPEVAPSQSSAVVEQVKSEQIDGVSSGASPKDSTVKLTDTKAEDTPTSSGNGVSSLTGDVSIMDIDVSDSAVFNNMDDTSADSITIANLNNEIAKLKDQLQKANTDMASLVQETDKMVDEIYAQNTEYINSLNEANSVISTLKQTIVGLNSSAGKYNVYAEHYRGVLQEGFGEDKEKIATLISNGLNVEVITSSDYSTATNYCRELLNKYSDTVIIDLTSDITFSVHFKLTSTSLSNLFSAECKDIANTSKLDNNNEVLSAVLYHDIFLLTANWGNFFENLTKLFGGKKIVLLLGSPTSFAVSYTLSKLATLFRVNFLTLCKPSVLHFVFQKLRFIPTNRSIRILVYKYYTGASSMVDELSKHYKVISSAELPFIDKFFDV